jgi:hypothetical protein
VSRPVSSWPTYLLTGLSKSERRSLSASAAAQNISVADVLRRILCERYELHCPKASRGYDTASDKGSLNLLLRLPTKVWKRLDKESTETGETKRAIILEAMRVHYEKGEQG